MSKGRTKNKREGPGKSGLLYDPSKFFVGLWEGVDPLDGSNIQRSVSPADTAGSFAFTGRVEFSQICGGDTSELPGGAPAVTSNQVPALLNAVGQLTEEGSLQIYANFTCFGDMGPRISGAPARYDPISPNMMLEVPSFRAQFPIVLHRMTQPFEGLF